MVSLCFCGFKLCQLTSNKAHIVKSSHKMASLTTFLLIGGKCLSAQHWHCATEASLVAALSMRRGSPVYVYYILSIQSDRSEASSSPWLLLNMHNTEIVSVSCNYSEIITNSHICNDICNSTQSKWNFFC